MNYGLIIQYLTLATLSINALSASSKTIPAPAAPTPHAVLWAYSWLGSIIDTETKAAEGSIKHANEMIEYLRKYGKLDKSNKALLDDLSAHLGKWSSYYNHRQIGTPSLSDLLNYQEKLNNLSQTAGLSDNNKQAIGYLKVDLQRLYEAQAAGTQERIQTDLDTYGL